MKKMFRRVMCLLAVMLMAVSVMAPTAAAYDGGEPAPRYAVCPEHEQAMCTHWRLTDVTPEPCVDGFHPVYIYKQGYGCPVSSCSRFTPNGMVRFETRCDKCK